MFLILFTYNVSATEIDALLPAHNEHLDTYFQAGLFLAAGPQDGQTGGVLLARGERTLVEAAVSTDPFVTSGAATADIVTFSFFRTSDALASLRYPFIASWQTDHYRLRD